LTHAFAADEAMRASKDALFAGPKKKKTLIG
jgi:hypothetical protein